MKINKLAAFATAALMMLSFGMTAAAEDPSSPDDELTDGTFTFELENGGYTIVSCNASAIITEIPAMRNGYPIVAIDDTAFAGCSFINELTIPKTVKTIGQYAFAGCSSLKTLTLSESLTEIPSGAFNACTSLTEVDVPEGVESIGELAFANCTALENIELPETLTSIGVSAFEECNALKEINIPSNVSSIGDMAFLDCASLEKITADNNESFVVEENILYNKDKTTIYRAAPMTISESFYIPDGVQTINGGAFSYCLNMKNLFIPESVTEIGMMSFYFCAGLTDIDFSGGIVEIGSLAFAACTSLKSVELPTTLTTVGDGAFYDAENLETLRISDGVASIGAAAFMNCPKLKTVVIPSSVKTIGENAFGFTENSDAQIAKTDGFSMSVNAGSAAEKYARTNDIDYDTMDRSIKQIAFIIVGVGALIAAAVFAIVLMRRGKKLAPADVRKAESTDADENAPDYKSIVDNEEE